MDKYSKINIMTSHTQNSRSIDFSDLQSFSPTQKSTNTTNPTNNTTTTQAHNGDGDIDERNNQNPKGERFGSVVSLKRNSSVSSSSVSSGFQSAVKGAFSMKRSSSVSERYCRIHDQSTTTLTSPIDDDEDQAAWGTTRSIKQKHKGGKILKACKRFFGL